MTRAFVLSCGMAGLLALAGMGSPLAQSSVEGAQEVSDVGVPYISGGVGKHEREQLEAVAKDYNLKLVFAQSSGAFVAEVQVTVMDGTGSKVVDATSNGPWFFAKLPAGTYSVEAAYGGVAKQSDASVPATGQRSVDFRW